MSVLNKHFLYLVISVSIVISPQIMMAQPGPQDAGPNDSPPDNNGGGGDSDRGGIENEPPSDERRPPPGPPPPGSENEDYGGPGDDGPPGRGPPDFGRPGANGPPSLSPPGMGGGPPRGGGGGQRIPCKAACLETRRTCLVSKRCGYGDFFCAQECEDGTYACISACRQNWSGGRGGGGFRRNGGGGGGGCWREFRVCAEECQDWNCRRGCRDRARECQWARRRNMCQALLNQNQVMT